MMTDSIGESWAATNGEAQVNPNQGETQQSSVLAADGICYYSIRGSSDGDPHITTFDGLGYSFQAAGEFILFRTEDGDSEFQVRQEPWGNRADVSANTAVSTQLGDTHVGLYAGRPTPLMIDEEPVTLDAGQTIEVGTGTVHFDGYAYTITDAFGNGVWARASTSEAFMNLRPFVCAGQEIEGLLGNADGNRANDMALRDGPVLEQPLTRDMLYGEFADSWRISEEESLFIYDAGESTETFTDRDFPSNATLSDLDPAARAEAEAIALAAGLEPGTFAFETTVIDLALTGVREFAEAVTGNLGPFIDTDLSRLRETTADHIPETLGLMPEETTGTIGLAFNEVRTDTAFVVTGSSMLTFDVLAGTSEPGNDALALIDFSAIERNTGTLIGEEETVEIVDGQLHFTPPTGITEDTLLTYRVRDDEGDLLDGRIEILVGPGERGNTHEALPNGNYAPGDVPGNTLIAFSGVSPDIPVEVFG